MDGKDGKRRAWCASMATVVLASGPVVAKAGGEASNVRLVHSAERFAVARAVEGAARKLADPSCQALLDEFTDEAGHSLRTSLDGLGLSAPEFLQRVFFYDGPSRLCGTSGLAVTTPGSRAVFVCGARFVREMSRNDRHAEGTIIHEMLHSLGLGENPPSSDEIDTRVRARCGEAGASASDSRRRATSARVREP